MQHPTLDELPDILTIHEVANFMRISPAVAYEMAYRSAESRPPSKRGHSGTAHT